MKKIFFTGVCGVGMLAFCFSTQQSVAFTNNNDGDSTKVSSAKMNYTTHLACGDFAGGIIEKNNFLDLIQNKICAKDVNNKSYTIAYFDLVYAERGLYQDSAGIPTIMTDYSSTFCNGDTVPKLWQNTFKERLYKGDTVSFENVILYNGAKKFKCMHPLKCIIK